ncbi:MAG: DUF2240 family protein [Euryarchaeota archaeon]|nr:DUF2240 family protein [Euryarchaeota archaeon]
MLAFLFNRSGKTDLTEAELYLPLAMELSWFSTKEAQQFVKYAMKRELVMKKDGMLSPNFPLDTIKIPVGFTPSKKIFSETTDDKKGEDIIEEIVFQIFEQTHQDKTEIQKEIKREGAEKNLLAEVAALYIARKHGVDVSEWYSVIEKSIVKENKV